MHTENVLSPIGKLKTLIESDLQDFIRKPDSKRITHLCECYRLYACRYFLFSYDQYAYQQALYRSCGAFAYFLENTKPFLTTGAEYDVVFDAISLNLRPFLNKMTGSLNSSLGNLEHFSSDPSPNYAYYNFLLSYFFDTNSFDRAKASLMQYEKVANNSSRFTLCQAIYDKNPDVFYDAFDQFLFERENALLTPQQRDTEVFRYISIEALAYLKLAELMNFKMSRHYAQVPEDLRFPLTITFNAALWRQALPPVC